MHAELARLPLEGKVVIGEGERGEVDALWIGEKIGAGRGPAVDIAVVALEGTTICAKNLPNSISVVAIAEAGSLLEAPDVYMDKIAIGPGYPAGLVGLDRSPTENLKALAGAKNCRVEDITACILDRPRHARLIEEVRAAGASIRLIGDGDVTGVIHTTEPEDTGIDIYMGIGGAPEGVLAAAALRCIGGQMEGRLMLDRPEKVERARALGITDPNKVYGLEDMVRGDVLFAATGVTDGNFLQGVKFGRQQITTHTVVMRSSTGTVRWIRARHTHLDKFES
jgi:fructose-1,6-bisphosphatase II / sedoheptulose-1,7-bisphosphatase